MSNIKSSESVSGLSYSCVTHLEYQPPSMVANIHVAPDCSRTALT